MNVKKFNELLDYYDVELSGLLSRFKRSSSGIHIDREDDPQYRQYIQELVDLLNDCLGPNTYSRQITAEANDGVANYLGSPSFKSVQNILSKIKSVKTRINQNPQILVGSSGVPRATSDGDQNTASPELNVWNLMHPKVAELAKPRFLAGHYADAVEAAFKELNGTVKALHKTATGEELDGVPLMRKALTPSRPTVVLDDLRTETGRNIQQGYMDLFAGSMAGIRNPKAHGNLTITPERALHLLVLGSLLFSKLEERP